MKCADCLERMDDYLDMALPQGGQRELEMHLAECAACRERIRSIQSLLCQSAALPKRISPAHDLWPAILASLQPAGITPADIPAPRPIRWSWRLAAALAAGAAILLATTFLLTHPQRPQHNSQRSRGVPDKTGEAAQPTIGKSARGPLTDQAAGGARNDTTSPKEVGALADTMTNPKNCQCEPPSETQAIVENALLVDENLSSTRSAEVVSNRLFNLAREKEDDFFLYRISLDVLYFPSEVPGQVRDRYRQLRLAHPDDAGLTYLYAYSLYGKNTPEMIRLMQQLIAENPDFPWPYLALARVHGYPNAPVDMSRSGYVYSDPDKVRAYIKTFMKLCPESPEPVRVLFPVTDATFFAETLLRMRELLVTRTDTRSLLMYPALWRLERDRRAGETYASQYVQKVTADLKRLQSLAKGRPPGFISVLSSGYQQIGEMETRRAILDKDTSYEGHSSAYAFDSQEWELKNPAPATDALAETRAAYWEKRLQRNDLWIKRAPELSFVWMDRLKALSELKNRPESEFTALGELVLMRLREGDSIPVHFLMLPALYAKRGIRLDQVPSMIKEGLAAIERIDHEHANDLISPQSGAEMRGFGTWRYADDAWHELFDAYVRNAEFDKARSALNEVERGLQEWQKTFASLRAKAQADDSYVRSVATNELLARERWVADARARLAAGKK